MKKRVFILVIALILSINSVAFGFSDAQSKARSYLLADFESGEIFKSYNIDVPIEIASITKLLSYYVIMDEISKGSINYTDIIVIDKDIESVKGSSYKLKAGERFTVEKLLKATIVISGNDATYAIAKHIAGSEAEFVKLMKAKAKSLGLINAQIYNSSGLPINSEGLQNKMTAREVFILARSLLQTYPQVLKLSRIPFISEPNRNFLELNTNPLLKNMEGIDGLKTGFTGKAGYCLVATLNIKGEIRRTENLKLIGITMGSKTYDDRTEAIREIMEYGKNTYEKRIFTNKDQAISKIEYPNGDPMEIKLYPKENFSKLIEKDTVLKYDVILNNKKLPIEENTILGTVTVYENGRPTYSTDLINKDAVVEANTFTLISRFYENLFNQAETIFSK